MLFYVSLYSLSLYLGSEITRGRTKTFEQYREQKSQQWKGFSKKSKKSKESNVVISIGLMEWREKECKLMIKRGKKIPLRISDAARKEVIQTRAELKWKNYHPDLFQESSFYTLLYESGEEIVTLPGSLETFTLRRYKEEIGKDFKRITLYLCSENDLKVRKLTEHSDSDDFIPFSAPESKRIKVSDEKQKEEINMNSKNLFL